MEDQVHGGIYHDEQVNIPVRFLSVKLKDEIKEELGFTVNIGISTQISFYRKWPEISQNRTRCIRFSRRR